MLRRFDFLIVACLIVLVSACAVESAVPESGVDVAEVTGELSAESSEELHGELVILAAASLTEAFGVIATDFQAQYPGTTILYNFAGSQQLAQQLGQGAPADLFASADERQMEVAIEADRVESATPRTFARNRLIVIYPGDNPAGIITLQDLAKPGLKLVVAAPEVPVGGYSQDFLQQASRTGTFGSAYGEAVLANVVSYEESVRSVRSKVALGEADAGIVYASDVAGDSADSIGRIDIPDELNIVASYPIAPVIDSHNPALAQAFIDYLLSPPGQAILTEHGFIPASAP